VNKLYKKWRQLTLIRYFLLLTHITLWLFVADPPTNKSIALLSITYLLILILPWQSLVADKSRVYLWSSYLILLYFMHAIVESYANSDARIFAIIELVLTLCYFVSSTFCYRYSRQLAKQPGPADTV